MKQITNVLKKMPLAGVGDLKAATDVLNDLLASVEKARHGLQDVIAHEAAKVFSKVDFQRIVNDIVQNYSLKVSAEIHFEPKSAGKSGSVKKRKGK